MNRDDDRWMDEAIEVAKKNPSAPFGAVLVDRRLEEVVARGVNSASTNPTLHGEIAALGAYAKADPKNWSHLTLYTTAEPCCMCQGALVWAGATRVAYGVSIGDLKQLGWDQIDISAAEVTRRSWRRDMRVVPGVRRAMCLELFRNAQRTDH